MARLNRLCVPGALHHVMIRGNNSQVFAQAQEDFSFLHGLWLTESSRHGVKVHGYVFLPSSMQVLLTPFETHAMAKCMQAVGRMYVTWFNKKYDRSGTLWQGRFRSTVIDAGHWLLPSLMYLDWAPVRAGLVQEAPEHPWGSYRHYSGQARDPLIHAPEGIWELGNTPFARESQYAEMVQNGPSVSQVVQIAQALESGWPLGSTEFVANLQSLTMRRLSPLKPGRPKKVA
ncbi:MAG: transposase [Betaproteobacteria bacterium]|jgi:putative transposase